MTTWWKTLLLRKRAERYLDAELRDHIERHAAELRLAGLSEIEARRRALLAFGGVDQVKERCREVGGLRLWLELRADLVFAGRLYRRSPVFAAVVIASIALAVGVNTALFSLADALLLRPLPVGHAERLVQVNRSGPGGAGPVMSFPAYRALRDATTEAADLLATSRVWRWNVRSGPAPVERIAGELVSRNYFETLHVTATIGRLFSGEDSSADASVVLSHAFWTRRFHGDRSVVGQALTINGVPVTIAGVAGREFTGIEVGDPVDMWAPLDLQPRLLNGPSWLEQPGNNWLRVVARLEPNVTAVRLGAMAHAAFRSHLAARAVTNDERIIVADASHGLSGQRERIQRPMAFLALLVAMVLLTACVNVATLHLGRMAQRERELAVRLALGGGRGRLGRQLLTENLLLSGVGASLGLALAWATKDVLLALLFPASERAPIAVDLNGRVLMFTATLGVLTGVLSGVLPVRLAWRLDLNDGLRQASSRATEAARGWAGFVLPTTQIGLTFVLLFGAALFARSLQSLRAVDPGFDSARVLAVRLDVQSLPYTPAAFGGLYRALLERPAALPGVRRVALADQALFTQAVRQRNVSVDGFAPAADADLNPYCLSVSTGFFESMGMALAAGRDFEPADLSDGGTHVAVVNQSFARYYFDGANAIGRRFGFGGQGAARDVTIVGVVEDAKYSDLRQDAPHLVYTPLAPAGFPTRSFSFSETTLTVRGDGDPAQLAATVRRLLADIDPALTVIGMATLQQHVDKSLAQDRLLSWLSTLFAVLALGLTGAGIYGVASYGVSRQVREIGVRLALGARPAQVRWMIARRGLIVLVAGLGLGVPAALLAAQLLADLLFNVARTDLPSLGFALAAITALTVVAVYGPARAAARVDPLVALRGD